MKTDLESLRESFKLGYETFEPSFKEATMIDNMERGFVYTRAQMSALRNRMQPAEYFNIILLFNRSLRGYFSSVVNTIATSPIDAEDTHQASNINIALEYTLRMNDWDILKDEAQHSMFNAGMAGIGYSIEADGKDRYGRAKNKIIMEHVPHYEIVLDPKSAKADYSDARFQHRHRWISRDEIKLLFPRTWTKLDSHHNTLDVEEAEITYTYSEGFDNRYQIGEEYLVVDTVVVNDKGKRERIFWSGDVQLKREPFKMGKLKFAYRTIRLNAGKRPEFYGIHHDTWESQNAINQAILQIQLLANTNKIIVEDTALNKDGLEAFQASVNRVNEVIPVKRLTGIDFKDTGRDILNQYTIIDKALERIQKVLHINDSFLGQAYNQDSGKKVALQKNSAMMALRYLNTPLDMLYRYIGLDLIELQSTFVDAEMQVQTNNPVTQQPTWNTINKPIMQLQPDGSEQPLVEYKEDGKGGLEKKMYNEPSTSLKFDRMDIKVESIPYDNNEAQDKLMLEQTIQGPMGQMLQQASPGAFFQIGSLLTKEYRTKHSPEIAAILQHMAIQMGYQAPVADPRMVEAGMPGQPGGGEQPAGSNGAGAMAKTMGMDTNSMNLADKQ